MKAQVTLNQKKNRNTIGYVVMLLLMAFTFNPAYAQTTGKATAENSENERTVKGVISDAFGPLEGANIILKGTKTGTVSDEKGEFTFPKPLKTNDILLISFLGYETTVVEIKEDTDFIRQTLSESLLEFVGALNSNEPYRSKGSN